MSSRLRVLLAVGVASVAAAGATVGITLTTRTPTPHAAPAPSSGARMGTPPLVLDLGVRLDREARDLRRASALYDGSKRKPAAALFGRYRSLEAQVGAAFAAWPGGFARIRSLAAARPRSGLVQLNYGLALFWRGDTAAAERAWRRARTAAPDSLYAVRAEDLLYPNYPRGLPTFVPGTPAPVSLDRLSPPRQLESLAREARAGGEQAHLLYGVALQRLGHQRSALRQYEAAEAAAPHAPEPQVAAAVARFDKADPSATFSRLGPLAKAFPRSPSVRFHLGLCLLWLGQVKGAEVQLRAARAADPQGILGREAQQFLDRLGAIGG